MSSRDHTTTGAAGVASQRSAGLISQVSGLVHDFRPGRQGWGHALHASFWKEAPDGPTAARATVPVHCTPSPRIGDRLLMTGQSGKSWDLAVIGVKSLRPPDDMYLLTLEFDKPPLADAAAQPRTPESRQSSPGNSNDFGDSK